MFANIMNRAPLILTMIAAAIAQPLTLAPSISPTSLSESPSSVAPTVIPTTLPISSSPSSSPTFVPTASPTTTPTARMLYFSALSRTIDHGDAHTSCSDTNEAATCFPTDLAAYASVAAGALAVQHFNAKDPSVVAELSGLNCSVFLEPHFLDTGGDSVRASRQFLEISDKPDLVVVDGKSNSVALMLALLAGIDSVPITSDQAMSSMLDDVSSYPTFRRVIPSDDHFYRPISDWVTEVAKFTETAIIYPNNAYGRGLSRSLEIELVSRGCKVFREPFSPAEMDPNRSSVRSAVAAVGVSSITVRSVISLSLVEAFEVMVESAVKFELMGPGFSWMFIGHGAKELETIQSHYLRERVSGIGSFWFPGGISSAITARFGHWRTNFDMLAREWESLGFDGVSELVLSTGIFGPKDAGSFPASRTEPNATTFPPEAAYAYDAVMASAMATCLTCGAFGYNCSFSWDALELNKRIASIEFSGATGLVRFNNLTGSRTIETATTLLTNVFLLDDTAVIESATAGLWTLGAGWMLDDQQPFIFADGSHTPPKSPAPEPNCPDGSLRETEQDGVRSKCERCEKGRWGTDCSKVCLPGHFCPSGTRHPRRCPAGRYTDSSGASSITDCINCPVGRYGVIAGGSSLRSGCLPCPQGMTTIFAASTSASSCVCQEGSYRHSAGNGTEKQQDQGGVRKVRSIDPAAGLVDVAGSGTLLPLDGQIEFSNLEELDLPIEEPPNNASQQCNCSLPFRFLGAEFNACLRFDFDVATSSFDKQKAENDNKTYAIGMCPGLAVCSAGCPRVLVDAHVLHAIESSGINFTSDAITFPAFKTNKMLPKEVVRAQKKLILDQGRGLIDVEVPHCVLCSANEPVVRAARAEFDNSPANAFHSQRTSEFLGQPALASTVVPTICEDAVPQWLYEEPLDLQNLDRNVPDILISYAEAVESATKPRTRKSSLVVSEGHWTENVVVEQCHPSRASDHLQHWETRRFHPLIADPADERSGLLWCYDEAPYKCANADDENITWYTCSQLEHLFVTTHPNFERINHTQIVPILPYRIALQVLRPATGGVLLDASDVNHPSVSWRNLALHATADTFERTSMLKFPSARLPAPCARCRGGLGVGDELCGDKYRGYLCGACRPGYYLKHKACSACPSRKKVLAEGRGSVVGMVLVAILFLLLIIRASRHASILSRFEETMLTIETDRQWSTYFKSLTFFGVLITPFFPCHFCRTPVDVLNYGGPGWRTRSSVGSSPYFKGLGWSALALNSDLRKRVVSSQLLQVKKSQFIESRPFNGGMTEAMPARVLGVFLTQLAKLFYFFFLGLGMIWRLAQLDDPDEGVFANAEGLRDFLNVFCAKDWDQASIVQCYFAVYRELVDPLDVAASGLHPFEDSSESYYFVLVKAVAFLPQYLVLLVLAVMAAPVLVAIFWSYRKIRGNMEDERLRNTARAVAQRAGGIGSRLPERTKKRSVVRNVMKDRDVKDECKSFGHNVLEALTVFLWIIYVPCTTVCLRVFSCIETPEGIVVLRADRNQECGGQEYEGAKRSAMSLLGIYAVWGACFFLIIVFYFQFGILRYTYVRPSSTGFDKEKNERKRRLLKALKFIVGGHKESTLCFLYDLILMIEVFFLLWIINEPSIGPPDIRFVAYLLVLSLVTVFQALFQPFIIPLLNTLALTMRLALLSTAIFLAPFATVPDFAKTNPKNAGNISTAVVFINVSVLTLVGVALLVYTVIYVPMQNVSKFSKIVRAVSNASKYASGNASKYTSGRRRMSSLNHAREKEIHRGSVERREELDRQILHVDNLPDDDEPTTSVTQGRDLVDSDSTLRRSDASLASREAFTSYSKADDFSFIEAERKVNVGSVSEEEPQQHKNSMGTGQDGERMVSLERYLSLGHSLRLQQKQLDEQDILESDLLASI